ncbi:MAG: metalloregulator ArsR/SmtB family transcription factor [Deltaproteobacteria bacterium]|nr:metalloregulator ArsR/SmtB family transcription factor [Deltaproteobacteria bacterium]
MATDLRDLALAHYGELARIGKALGSPVRLQILDLLRQGPRSVESIAEQSGVTLANTSQHLQQLRAARLVDSEKHAQRVVYRLADDTVSLLFAAMRDLAEALLPELDRIREELDAADEESRTALLQEIRAKKVTLIDVRPRDEYRAGHVPGAISIPLEELKLRLTEIPKARQVVAYCRGPYCPLALAAVAVLESAGFKARHLDLGAPDLPARRFKLAVVEGDADGDLPPTAPSTTPRKKRRRKP